MAERCAVRVALTGKMYSDGGYYVDEFGRKFEPAPNWKLDFAVVERTIRGTITCRYCRFSSIAIVATGKLERDVVERFDAKVRQFLLEKCEAGKKFLNTS